MDQDVHMPAPEVTKDPLSVHLWYMRKDIGEIKNTLSTMRDGFVTRTDFEEHLKADEDHEERIRTIEKDKETDRQYFNELINKVNVKIATYIGIAVGGAAVIQFILTYFIINYKH